MNGAIGKHSGGLISTSVPALMPHLTELASVKILANDMKKILLLIIYPNIPLQKPSTQNLIKESFRSFA